MTRVVMICGAISTMASACADPIASAPVIPGESVIWRVRVEPRGVTMAIGQTLMLKVTAFNILGDTMTLPDSAKIQFKSGDSSRAFVSPDGMLRGERATLVNDTRGQLAPIPVFTTVALGTVVKVDTIFVAVTDTAPTHPAATVSIVPPAYPADSTWYGFPSNRVIPIMALTTTGDTIKHPYLFLHTDRSPLGLNEQLLPQSRLMLFLRTPGRFWIYATGSIYGVMFRDSAEYIQGDVLGIPVGVKPHPENPNEVEPLLYLENTLTAVPCSEVRITNDYPASINVSFDGPSETTVCTPGDETGNVTALPPNGTAIRKFKTTGTYTWTVTRTDGVLFTRPFTGKVRIRAHAEF